MPPPGAITLSFILRVRTLDLTFTKAMADSEYKIDVSIKGLGLTKEQSNLLSFDTGFLKPNEFNEVEFDKSFQIKFSVLRRFYQSGSVVLCLKLFRKTSSAASTCIAQSSVSVQSILENFDKNWNCSLIETGERQRLFASVVLHVSSCLLVDDFLAKKPPALVNRSGMVQALVDASTSSEELLEVLETSNTLDKMNQQFDKKLEEIKKSEQIRSEILVQLTK
jgi:hypothetical protein